MRKNFANNEMVLLKEKKKRLYINYKEDIADRNQLTDCISDVLQR